MSIRDGGPFECGEHDKVFQTTDPEVWEAHLNDGKHYLEGATACTICGKDTTFTKEDKKIIGKKVVCNDCKADLTS